MQEIGVLDCSQKKSNERRGAGSGDKSHPREHELELMLIASLYVLTLIQSEKEKIGGQGIDREMCASLELPSSHRMVYGLECTRMELVEELSIYPIVIGAA